MVGFAAVDYVFAREVLQRGVAALFLIAFASSRNQFRALLGEHGLLPAPELLAWARSSRAGGRMLRPTLFRWWRYTDRRLAALCWCGMAVAALLVAGLPQRGPSWASMLAFLALWFGYMSISSIGQTFYGFGWEMLLLEAGFLVAFLGSHDEPPPTAIVVLLWWLVFRLEFGAGMIKMRGGREWRDLTALMYHHETQPMPGPLSRRAHLLPAWFHRLEVVGNHVAQLGAPWLLFVPLLSFFTPGPIPALIGTGGAAVVIATQLWLLATGNFAWLNALTIVAAFSAVGVPGGASPASDPPATIDGMPAVWVALTSLVFVGCVALSGPALRNLFAHRQLMNASFNRWQLANAYGAFGTVTTERIEFVIEGTRDADPDAARWHEYQFKGKPGDVRRRPRQVAPYHLRLDWLMWFLPLGRSLDDWFARLLVRLLEADAATLRLLRIDPFRGLRPRWIRVVSYRYRFASEAAHRATSAVWIRDRRRVIVRPIGLSSHTDRPGNV